MRVVSRNKGLHRPPSLGRLCRTPAWVRGPATAFLVVLWAASVSLQDRGAASGRWSDVPRLAEAVAVASGPVVDAQRDPTRPPADNAGIVVLEHDPLPGHVHHATDARSGARGIPHGLRLLVTQRTSSGL